MNAKLLPFYAIAMSSLVAVAAASDWLQFGGPTRNFAVPRNSDAPIESAKSWRANIAGGDASIVVCGERLFVSAIDFASDGTDAHRIACFDRLIGTPIWEKVFAENSFVSQDISDRFPVRPLSTPTIVGDRIIACGFGGSVRCLDRKTGELLWHIDLVKEYGSSPIQYGYACSPWSDGKQIVVACGGDIALMVSLSVKDGSLIWKCGSGLASYTSPLLLQISSKGIQEKSQHLVYAGGDELIGVDPNSGKILWSYVYEKRGLTNAVTPIVVADNKVLVGGQGVSGSRLLSIESVPEGFRVKEVWHNSKASPFYCNWIQLPVTSQCVLGFIGKTLTLMNWTSGEIIWQKRDWTDCNLLSLDSQVLAVRGDGFVGLLNVDEKGLELVAGDDSVNDRIWAPPTIVDRQIYLLGRSRMVCLPLIQLRKMKSIPNGTEVTSMDAMYGSRPERIQKLIDLAKGDSEFPVAEYMSAVFDRSVEIGEGDYNAIFQNLSNHNNPKAALEIALNWTQGSPYSIPAWERYVNLLRKSGREKEADAQISERMVQVTVEMTPPLIEPMPKQIFISGNVATLGPWKPDGLELKPNGSGKYTATFLAPRGDFQFKFTCGSFETVEVRTDGRSISNRRQRLSGPITLSTDVQAWKK